MTSSSENHLPDGPTVPAGPTAPPESPREPRGLPAVRIAMVLAFLLHAGAVLWTWGTWESGLRGSWLVWIDFPVSLLYLEARSGLLLLLSLILGGAWWGGIGGALSWLIGRVVKGD